jgi:hypothetical protein
MSSDPRYGSAGDALYRSHHTRCRYGAEQLWSGWYAVVERQTSAIVISGFSSYEAAWSWIASRLDARCED